MYTPTEVSKIVGTRPQHIYNLIKGGYLKGQEVEVMVTKIMVSEEDLQDYLNRKEERDNKKAAKVQKELEAATDNN